MIFRRSLVREMTVTAVGLFLVLLGILFTNLVLRLLALAAGGAVAPDGLAALLGFNALFYFNILLSVTIYVTVLLTLVRWYRDSEMIVWFTSGVGLTACLRPIMWFGAPFFVAILVLSLFLSPWAEQRKLEYQRQLESRDEITLISPGLFREFRRANLVVFVESINTFDGTIRNVFLQSVEDGKDAITVARSGSLQVAANGDRFIVLDDGRRYEGKPGSNEYRIVEFGRLGRRIEPAELRALPTSTRAIPTPLLIALDGPVERAELFWRLSVPISAFVLTLLAVPLAYVNPRIGRSFNLFAAAFMYMLYSNCLNIVQSFIAQGKLGFLPGLVLPHAIAIGIVLLLYGHQLSLFGVFRRGPRAEGAPRHEDADALHRPRGAVRHPADLQRAGDPVRVLRPDPRAGRRRARRLHDFVGIAVRRAAAAVAHVRALSRGVADRHAVRAGAARLEFGVHRDARVGRVAAAGRAGRWCASASRCRSSRFSPANSSRRRPPCSRAASARRRWATRRASSPSSSGRASGSSRTRRSSTSAACSPISRSSASASTSSTTISGCATCARRNREASPATANGA